jgi:hypothetical protein
MLFSVLYQLSCIHGRLSSMVQSHAQA